MYVRLREEGMNMLVVAFVWAVVVEGGTAVGGGANMEVGAKIVGGRDDDDERRSGPVPSGRSGSDGARGGVESVDKSGSSSLLRSLLPRLCPSVVDESSRSV